MRYVGKIFGQEVRISSDSPNPSIVITGLSGSGKSERNADIERHDIESGGTVIALDLDGTHSKIDEEMVNRISLRKDGIALPFLDTEMLQKPSETLAGYVSTLGDILLCGTRAGDRQKGIMREAIILALEHREQYKSDLKALDEELLHIGTECALGLRDKIWPLLQSNIFRKSDKVLKKGKINIITFEDLDCDLKCVATEIILRSLWNRARTQSKCSSITISIDEFQKIFLGKKSVAMELLREGRKYGITMLLATQTLAALPKESLAVINQAAVRLYFRPAINEVKKIADQIDSANTERVISMLKGLKVGESLAIGDLEMNGKKILNPIIIRTDYRDEHGRTENCAVNIWRRM